MGGLGSGRRKTSSLGHVECTRSIDLTWLKQQGNLRVGWEGRLNWRRDGRIVGSVNFRAEQDGIRLVYRVRVGEGDWEQVTDWIAIVHVPCRYGGDRPYFVCAGKPGAACDRRVLSVYGSGRLFLCRHCTRLSYRLQSEDTAGRTRRRALKSWRRLGGDDISVAHNRPKGMWRRTFDRLIDRAIAAEMLADDECERRTARLEERIGK